MDRYIFLIVIFTSLIISQLLKFIIEAIKYKKINIYRLLDGSGGMPSSHSAIVSSVTMTVFLLYGGDSPLFAVSLVFSLITMYDAMGIRYESGKQAAAINKLNEKMAKLCVRKEKTKLNEQIGHKKKEVLCGMLLGIIVSVILVKIII